MFLIRKEQPEDIEVISKINIKAFGQTEEANIINKLRQKCNNLISLVAVRENQVVGHILFSPVTIEHKEGNMYGMGLAPMAVLPEHQKKGIGSELVRAGISRLENRKCPFIIVIGHPDYYPRFGFIKASQLGIKSEWDVPDEAFMILVLDESKLQGISGMAKYLPEFAEAM